MKYENKKFKAVMKILNKKKYKNVQVDGYFYIQCKFL